jgi:hypothetical protein
MSGRHAYNSSVKPWKVLKFVKTSASEIDASGVLSKYFLQEARPAAINMANAANITF